MAEGGWKEGMVVGAGGVGVY